MHGDSLAWMVAGAAIDCLRALSIAISPADPVSNVLAQLFLFLTGAVTSAVIGAPVQHSMNNLLQHSQTVHEETLAENAALRAEVAKWHALGEQAAEALQITREAYEALLERAIAAELKAKAAEARDQLAERKARASSRPSMRMGNPFRLLRRIWRR